MPFYGRPPIDPSNIRPRLMLDVAGEMMLQQDWPYRAVTIQMESHGGEPESFTFYGANHPKIIEEVFARRVDVSMLNPAALLTMAYRGVGAFSSPKEVAVIAMLPHYDQLGFAVADRLGFNSLADIATQCYPLRLSVRGSLDAATSLMVDVVLQAHGFSLADLVSWGGTVSYDQPMPNDSSRLGRLAAGEIDAIFDEGIVLWANHVSQASAHFLSIDEAHLHALQAHGFRRGLIEKARYASLPNDIPTVDCSGWPIYCRADTPDRFVEHFCRALVARREHIQWDTGGVQQAPLPLERMVAESPSTPMDVPLHPRAVAFWKEQGYLSSAALL